MGLLGELARGLVRGADRTAAWMSKRGPRSFYKGRGSKFLGYLTASRKFKLVPEQVPRLVVPNLSGFRLKAYVSYRDPSGSEPPLTACALFDQAAAPAIGRDLREGVFDPQRLEKYGFQPNQEEQLFRLFPKNFMRYGRTGRPFFLSSSPQAVCTYILKCPADKKNSEKDSQSLRYKGWRNEDSPTTKKRKKKIIQQPRFPNRKGGAGGGNSPRAGKKRARIAIS